MSCLGFDSIKDKPPFTSSYHHFTEQRSCLSSLYPFESEFLINLIFRIICYLKDRETGKLHEKRSDMVETKKIRSLNV